jgi:gliding motility-associated-like protein
MSRILFLCCFVCCILITLGAEANTNFNYTQTCYGNQTTLVAVSSLPDASISAWEWDLDANGTYEKSGKTIIFLFNSNTPVPVKLRITPIAGSADSVTNPVTIDPLPLVNFIANNLCESYAATYISQSTIASGSINQYLWDFDDDGITDDNSNDTVSYTAGPAQTYLTKLTCVSNKGCSAFTQKQTTVYPNPVAGFAASSTCLGNNTVFTNTTSVPNPDYYSWTFGDGTGTVASGNTVHTYGFAFTYTVQLIAVSLAGCRDTFVSTVQVNPIPTGTITFDKDSIFFKGGSVILTANTGTGITYAWSTGESTQSITVTDSARYVCTITDANGCTTNLYGQVTMKEVPDTVSVSGFILTPNDDNINDVLVIQNISAYSTCNLSVYSMWNDKVFETTSYKNDWKGTNSGGETLPAGAYYYIVKCDDKTVLNGNINILR